MHVISRKTLRAYAQQQPRSRRPLDLWYAVARRAAWRSIRDVRRIFPTTDGGVVVASGRKVTVFNIHANAYRLIVDIHYNRQKLYILRVMTHTEYDKGRWKLEL